MVQNEEDLGGKEGDKTGGVTKWERDGGAEWLRW